jgi:TPR repeat protein
MDGAVPEVTATAAFAVSFFQRPSRCAQSKTNSEVAMSKTSICGSLFLAVVLSAAVVPVQAGKAAASPAPVTEAGKAAAGSAPFAEAERAYNEQDYATAMKLAMPLAEAGDADAQYLVGRMYEKGQGVPADKAKVLLWYRKSAEGGNAKAQYKLGAGYAMGFSGLKQSNEKAKKWIKMSAEQGYHRAQKILAYAYQKGLYGFPKDEQKAQYWFKEAEKKTIK